MVVVMVIMIVIIEYDEDQIDDAYDNLKMMYDV